LIKKYGERVLVASSKGYAWAPEAININVEKINEKNTLFFECISVSLK
jgi:hypothetical protein